MNRRLRICIIILSFFAVGIGVWLSFFNNSVSLTAEKTLAVQERYDLYDLIVAGSDPEGIAAAISGARNGLRTLIADTRPELGGLMTRGWLNSIDMNYGEKNDILNKGIFLEFYKKMEGDSFDVNTAGNAFNTMVNNEKNLTVLLNITDMKPIIKSREKITGLKVVFPSGETREIRAQRVIDATQNADIAAAAGVPFTVSLSDCGRQGEFVAATLIFQLKGVNELNWLKLRLALKLAKDPHSGANGLSAWGFSKIMKNYVPLNERCAARGLNIGRQKDGRVLINALQVFGVDPLNAQACEEARALAEKEIPNLVEYIKKNIPGMSSVVLEGVAPELYIRQSRQMEGLYRLSIDDVLENRDFEDRIAFGSYPVDIQATSSYFKGDIIGTPQKYAIPFRCIVPRETENLLVVGRSTSFDSLAEGSARVIPVGMAVGQAAGAAAALSIESSLTFKEMSALPEKMEKLQFRLNSQGMELQPFCADVPWSNHWAYSGLKFMRHWGMASGGYANDFKLDEEMSGDSFYNGLSKIMFFTHGMVSPEAAKNIRGQKLTPETASQAMCLYMGHTMSSSQAYQYLQSSGFWEKDVLERIVKEGRVSRGAGYMMIKHFAEWEGNADNITEQENY